MLKAIIRLIIMQFLFFFEGLMVTYLTRKEIKDFTLFADESKEKRANFGRLYAKLLQIG